MIRYICKYTPVELFAAFGEETALYNPLLEDLDGADELTHRNMCSFSRAVIAGQSADTSGLLVLTDCCDSIRRARDVLKSLGQESWMISLPRRSDVCSQAMYGQELRRLLKDLEKRAGRVFNGEAFRAAFHRIETAGGPYVAVMGARMDDGLLEEIRRTSSLPVRNNTCTQLRRFGAPPAAEMEELLDWYAGELLAQTACMRMTDLSSRRALTEDPNLRGVVYNTVKFCDFYGFEYAALRDTLSVPMLKIETDYTPQGQAQLLTRLQAFFEGLGAPAATAGSKPARLESNRPAPAAGLAPAREKAYFAGIDSGSTSTNAIILDENKIIAASYTLPTGVQVAESARLALDRALAAAGLDRRQISRMVSTGYGRAGIAFRERDVTEITCHARGAFFLNPAVRTVIDVGGQDSKVIRLDERGGVRDFVMNDKCAAGTGRFLEMMAQSLGFSLEEMGFRGRSAREDITISSMCSVFAQSEVVSLIAAGKRLDDIVRGLNRSVAAKITTLAGRSGLEREWMMTGGVAKNPGVVAALEERLGGRMLVPAEPELCGALGAALIALDSSA